MQSISQLIEQTTVTTENKIFIKTTVTTEAMIQAEIYFELKNLGIKSYLELKLQNSRFDIAVVDNENNLAAIIECKKYKSFDKDFVYETKQIAKYKKFGVPVISCCRLSEIDKTVKKVRSILGAVNFETKSCDIALADYKDLINIDFKEWYCKMFYQLGLEKWEKLAKLARADGKRPKQYFSWLLKNESKLV